MACRPFGDRVIGSEPEHTRPQHFKATHYSQTKTSKYSLNQVSGLCATSHPYAGSKIIILVGLIDEVLMPDQGARLGESQRSTFLEMGANCVNT